MPSKVTPEEMINKLKNANIEAGRAKRSIVTLEKTAIKKVASIESTAGTVKTKSTEALAAANLSLAQDHKMFTDAAKEKLAEVEKNRKDTETNFNKFDKTYRAATHKVTGVEARHNKINELVDSSITANAQILRNETKAQNTLSKVKDVLSDARTNQKNISSINDNAESVNKAINETYQLTLDTTMSGSLIERRNALKDTAKNWSIAFLVSVGLVFIGVLLVAGSIIAAGDNADYVRLIIERSLLVTPLVIGAIITSRYYNHERKLYEEYAFKAASAQTIRGYTVLLNEEFKEVPDAQSQILAFTINVMTGIFDRQSIVQTPTLMHFIFGNNLAKFEAKIEDKLQDIVEASQKFAPSSATQVNSKQAVVVTPSE